MSAASGGYAAPAGGLPAETIRVEASRISVLLAPDGTGKLDIGLYLELPELRPLRITLNAEQLADLHEKLHTLLQLDADQVTDLVEQIEFADLVERIHNTESDNTTEGETP